MVVTGEPDPALRGSVERYVGFREETPEPIERREGPGCHVVLIVSFGEEWSIDGERLTSFAGGLRARQVATRHEGRSHGIHIDLAPPAAHRILRLPMRELAYAQVPLEELLDEPFLAERLAEAPSWEARFRLLDGVFARRLDNGTSREVDWAWRSLVEAGGDLRVARLAERLSWSRKRLAARFSEEVGLPPKTVARIARFERARARRGAAPAGLGPGRTRLRLLRPVPPDQRLPRLHGPNPRNVFPGQPRASRLAWRA